MYSVQESESIRRSCVVLFTLSSRGLPISWQSVRAEISIVSDGAILAKFAGAMRNRREGDGETADGSHGAWKSIPDR